MSELTVTREQVLSMLAGRRVVASISGGKDSSALSLYLSDLGIDHDRVFLDTGWEHDLTYEYLRGELTRAIGPITELRGDLPMEELILKKGMFPSRVKRFCTQHLKVFPMQKYLNARVEAGEDVINAVGVRAAESQARSKLGEFEWMDGFDCEVWRPLIRWTEQMVIDTITAHDLRPNPLYLMGASRVGCWPCIFARKSEIRFIAENDPARIDRIRNLERRVAEQSAVRHGVTMEALAAGTAPHQKTGEPLVMPTWFGAPDTAEMKGTKRQQFPIDAAVKWASTSHGGKQFEMFAGSGRDAGCVRWGLCATDSEPEDE